MIKKHYELTDKLTFGKHKGKTIEEVLLNDSRYLGWLLNNDIITVSKELKQEIEENINDLDQHDDYLNSVRDDLYFNDD